MSVLFHSREHQTSMHRLDQVITGSRVQQRKPRMLRAFPHYSRYTSQFALMIRMPVGKDEFNSDDDWKIIERIKDLFKGAYNSSLGQILKDMADGNNIDFDKLESVYLKLNFLARGLKAGLEDWAQSDVQGLGKIGDADYLTEHLAMVFETLNFHFIL